MPWKNLVRSLAGLWVISLAALATSCSSPPPCQTYCEDMATALEVIPDLLTEEQLAESQWFDDEGSLDRDAYLQECRSAPETEDCEECADWQFDTFLSDIGIAPDCIVAYRTPEDGTPEIIDNCRDHCGDAGLSDPP